MHAAKLEYFKRLLTDLRVRVTGGVDHVVESIQEDAERSTSGVPLHLADAANDTLDADVTVLANERGILQDIDAALGRIEAGEFGICEQCKTPIGETRLEAIPYTPYCIKCAQAIDARSNGRE